MISRLLLALSLAGLAAPAAYAEPEEQEQEFLPGIHYNVLVQPVTTQAPEGKTEILDFFWYGCPHCFVLEPMLDEWLKERADSVHSQHIPAFTSARWALGARVYYTLQELDRLDLHSTVFQLVHEQKRALRNAEGVARMLEPFGINVQAFTDAFHGETVSLHLEETKRLTEQFDIGGVPALVIDGKYVVSARNATSYQQILDITAFLVEKAP